MSFPPPTLLLLTPAPFALLGVRYWLRRRYWGHPGGSIWSHPRMQSWPWRYLPHTFLVLAMALLAVALADPRVERPGVADEAEGRAVVMVLDLSFTMQDR